MAALAAKIKINRDNFFVFRDAKNIVQREHSALRLFTKKEPWRFQTNNINETYKDIQNLQYHIENEYIQVTNFTVKFLPSSDVYFVRNMKNGPASLDNRFNPDKNKYGINLMPNNNNNNNMFGLFNKPRRLQKTRMNMMMMFQ